MATQTGTVGLGTKIKILFALLAVVAAYAVIKGARKAGPEDDVEERVVFSVIFKPGQRSEYPVLIVAKVETVPVDERFVTKSPYNSVITVPKGARLSLFAEQSIDGELDCLIVILDETIDHKHRDTRGNITCER